MGCQCICYFSMFLLIQCIPMLFQVAEEEVASGAPSTTHIMEVVPMVTMVHLMDMVDTVATEVDMVVVSVHLTFVIYLYVLELPGCRVPAYPAVLMKA